MIRTFGDKFLIPRSENAIILLIDISNLESILDRGSHDLSARLENDFFPSFLNNFSDGRSGSPCLGTPISIIFFDLQESEEASDRV